ncbi:MAG: hypothetical protein U0Q22_08760 [Acidimicrobiales bacterium]
MDSSTAESSDDWAADAPEEPPVVVADDLPPGSEHLDDAQPTDLERAVELLNNADPVAYHKSISSLLRGGPSSLLQPMPYSASRPYHAPRCVVVEPDQTGIETMQLYCHAAYPEFDRHLAEPFDDPTLDHLIASVYHGIMNEGINVALVTNHGQIHDIALVLAALVLALCNDDRTFGVLGERTNLEEISLRSNLLLSRMVAATQVFSVPTTQVLQSMCRTFYSVPQTASRRRAKLDPELARANNLVMRDRLERQLADGGQLLAMAASGSQDISLASGLARRVRTAWRQRRGEERDDTPSLHLQPLYNGTINLMLACHYVLPVAISLDKDHPACVVGGLTRVRTSEDCHDVMHWIAGAHEKATGVATVYHQREDDLLTQVRAALRSQPGKSS